jgi:hypothetical protein
MPNSYKSVAYSTTGSGSNEDVYTCGVVASVVKNLVVYNSSSTTAYAITVKIYKAASTTSYEINYQSVGARTAWNVLNSDGSINLQNGDKIQVVTSQAGLVVNLSYMESSVSVSGINLSAIADVSDVAATDNQVLTWDSATGLATWETSVAGGITNVTGTAPISVSGTTTKNVSISAATASAAGSMSADDKAKLNGIADAADVNQNAFSNIVTLGFQADGTTAVNLTHAAELTTDTFSVLFLAPLTLTSAGDDSVIVGTTAEANVNADWNAVSGDAQILNKPSLATVATSGSYSDLTNKPTIVSSVTGTAPIASSGGTTPAISISPASATDPGSMSSAHWTKLEGIAAGAEVNVNADWNAVSGDAQILNKPSLAAVATSGSYNDLTNKPTIVSSVTGTAPIVSSGGTTPAISIDASSATNAGSMSSDHWTKLEGISAGAEVNQNAFSNIAVSGQTTVAADSKTDTLTLIAGTNVTITTNATNDEVTISSNGGGSTNSFQTIAVSGQSSVVADSATDTLTLIAGSNITLTTNATNDEITIAASGGGGGTPAGNSGEIQFNSSGSFGASSGLFWDITNGRLGVGLNTGLTNEITASVADVNGIASFNTAASSATAGSNITVYSNDNAALVSGDRLGAFNFGGSTGVGTIGVGASIQGFSAGTFAPASIPSVMTFSTVPGAANTLAERMRIFNDGNIAIGETSSLAKLSIRGSGSTSGSSSLIIRNAGAGTLFQVRDDGKCVIGTGGVDGAIMLNIRGTTATSAESALRLWNSNSVTTFQVRNDGAYTFFGGALGLAQTGYTTFSNLTTLRTGDADTLTLGQLCDIVGTLILDLKIKGIIAS